MRWDGTKANGPGSEAQERGQEIRGEGESLMDEVGT